MEHLGDATSSRVDRGSTLFYNEAGDQRDERWVYVYSIGVRDIDDARGKSEMVVADWNGRSAWSKFDNERLDTKGYETI